MNLLKKNTYFVNKQGSYFERKKKVWRNKLLPNNVVALDSCALLIRSKKQSISFSTYTSKSKLVHNVFTIFSPHSHVHCHTSLHIWLYDLGTTVGTRKMQDGPLYQNPTEPFYSTRPLAVEHYWVYSIQLQHSKFSKKCGKFSLLCTMISFF